MGAFCCCPCGEEFEEYVQPNSSIQTPCICLRYFFHRLYMGYSGMFQRLEGPAVTSQVQGGTPLASTGLGTALSDTSLSETFHLIPRPAPFDTDPRYSRLQRDGLISRRDKSMSHAQDDSQVLRRSISSSGTEHLGVGRKRNGADSEEDDKSTQSELEKTLSVKASYAADYRLTSEDEDICPTCLDEYTPENPKILMRCSHHFHLGCIYEWMERSDNCPLCGEEMEFSESA